MTQEDALLHPWRRSNSLWSHLLPRHGFSRRLHRLAGSLPFRELQALGPLPPGGAVHTSAGRLSYRAIIHVHLPFRYEAGLLPEACMNAVRIMGWLDYRRLIVPLEAFNVPSQKLEQILHAVIQRNNSGLQVVLLRALPEDGTDALSGQDPVATISAAHNACLS